jgi:hypothetical protein
MWTGDSGVERKSLFSFEVLMLGKPAFFDRRRRLERGSVDLS